jgi:hypothetical protein
MKNIIKALICMPAAAMLIVTAVAETSINTPPLPFRGTLSGPEVFILEFPLLTVDGTGTGNATELGRFTASWHREISNVDGSQTASYEYVAANGDALWIESVGQADMSIAPDVHVLEIGTIIGGTGRFSGATGRVTIERIVVFTGPNTSMTSDSISGTIVLAHDR